MNKDVFQSCLVAAYRKARYNYSKADCDNTKTGQTLMVQGDVINRKWWANIVVAALRSNKRYKQQKAVDKYIKEEKGGDN